MPDPRPRDSGSGVIHAGTTGPVHQAPATPALPQGEIPGLPSVAGSSAAIASPAAVSSPPVANPAAFGQARDDLRRRSLRMASLVEELVRESLEAVLLNRTLLAEAVIARDRDVDRQEVEIEREVLRLLAQNPPSADDLRLLCAVLKINNDLERVADCAVNIAQRVARLDGRIPEPVARELRLMDGLVRKMLRCVMLAYGNHDVELAAQVLHQEAAADAVYGKLIQLLTADMSSGPEGVIPDVDLIIIAKNVERIADHATNIAEDVVFLVTGRIIRHQAWPSSAAGGF